MLNDWIEMSCCCSATKYTNYNNNLAIMKCTNQREDQKTSESE